MGLLLVLGLIGCGVWLLCNIGSELLSLTEELLALTGLTNDVFIPLFKTMAIALTVRIGSSFCRDASQNALASLMETAGAVCALVVAAPLLRTVIALLEGWL